ncbi:MAG: hypothetical protein ABIS27_02775, partial [Longimicrobiales bacterium]
MRTSIISFALFLMFAATGLSAQQDRATRPTRADPVNVRLTFILIQADGYTNEDPEIRPIVTELRKIF